MACRPFILRPGRDRREVARHARDSVRGSRRASGFPRGVNDSISTLRRAEPAWIEAQATSILQAHNDSIDAPVAPLLMAALQVCWVALSSRFLAEEVRILETAGLCPLCGTLPVASLVCAQSPYQGYRYLHCALCATEWHMVRVQCSSCGAMGKDIAYHSLKSNTADKVEPRKGAPRYARRPASNAADIARSSTRRRIRASNRWPTMWRASPSICCSLMRAIIAPTATRCCGCGTRPDIDR